MIRFDNVTFGYGLKKPCIKELSFEVPEGGNAMLFGRSGCGKTTVLRLVAGLEKPRAGIIKGTDGKTFSYVFQEDRLIPHMNVLENAALFANEEIAKEYLCKLGLFENLESMPSELSGGMRKRVAIARALSCDFDILLLDEPFAGLDDDNKKSCAEIILAAAKDKTIIFASHDINDAKTFGATVIRI